MQRYMSGIIGLLSANMKRFWRDKTALFFTFLFPLIFLLIFGTIFNNQSVSFKVVLINHSETEFAKQFVAELQKDSASPLKIQKNAPSAEIAKEKMKRSEIDGIIEIPKDFGEISATGQPTGVVKVLYQKGSEQAGSTLAAIMTQITNGTNETLGQSKPPLSVESDAVGEQGLTSFDYTFSGMLAFSLMSMGIFGLANRMPSEKQSGAYRRLRAAPFTSGQLIMATAAQFMIITLLSLVMMVVVGLLVFHFNMRGDWVTFGLFAIISSLLTIGFGLLIGSWANNENQSAPLGNLVSFPMMLLSGAFFPMYLFPEWLQQIAVFIPLTPVIEGFRRIMTEHASLVTLAPQLGMMIAWIAIVYVLAVRLFRWGDHDITS